MIRVAVAGAGRMGLAIQRLADERDDVEVVSLWRRGEDLSAAIAGADVVVDFSLPEATVEVAARAAGSRKPLVSGVSGLDDVQMAALNGAAKSIPVVYDRNMSQGIAVLDAAIRNVMGSIGPEFSVAIHETHHVHKQDAPSGTALKLGETVKRARGDAAIHYESERRGEVPGEHSIILESPTERLIFSHSVTTRDVFAAGALLAARWIGGRDPGLYSMQDVLFGD